MMFHLQRMKNRPGFFYLAAFIGLILLFLYLALPLLALFLKTTPEEILLTLTEPFVIQSLTLSLFTTVITTIVLVIIGTPVAFIQSRYPYPGKKIVDTFIDLPLVLPPAVAGLALLLLWGRMGLLGKYLAVFSFTIPFTTLAVVMSQFFVASPLYIRQARSLFTQLEKGYEDVARTLGAGPFRVFCTITLPLCSFGLISVAIMAFARALGEFGATIMFAGNLPGVTQTMPLAIYTAMQKDMNAAVTISLLLVGISLFVMLLVRILSGEDKNA
jgi:molybdate transport system permease protein